MSNVDKVSRSLCPKCQAIEVLLASGNCDGLGCRYVDIPYRMTMAVSAVVSEPEVGWTGDGLIY